MTCAVVFSFCTTLDRGGDLRFTGLATPATPRDSHRLSRCDINPQAIDGLLPMDSTKAFAQRLDDWDNCTLLAGHQPFIGKLAARLLCGKKDCLRLDPDTAGVIALERRKNGWQLLWMIEPSLLGE